MAKLKPIEQHTALALKSVQDGAHVPQHVFLPPAMRKVQVFEGTPPDVRGQVARIANEADPVGLLVAIAIGQPVPQFSVDPDGNLSAVYETLPLSNRYRLKVIEYLASQVLAGNTESPKQGSEDQGWAAAIRNAAARNE